MNFTNSFLGLIDANNSRARYKTIQHIVEDLYGQFIVYTNDLIQKRFGVTSHKVDAIETTSWITEVVKPVLNFFSNKSTVETPKEVSAERIIAERSRMLNISIMTCTSQGDLEYLLKQMQAFMNEYAAVLNVSTEEWIFRVLSTMQDWKNKSSEIEGKNTETDGPDSKRGRAIVLSERKFRR